MGRRGAPGEGAAQLRAPASQSPLSPGGSDPSLLEAPPATATQTSVAYAPHATGTAEEERAPDAPRPRRAWHAVPAPRKLLTE